MAHFYNAWHGGAPPRRQVEGDINISYSGLRVSATCTFTQSLIYPGSTGYGPDTAHLQIDGVDIDSVNVNPNGTSEHTLSGYRDLTAGNHTARLMMQCGDNSGECKINNNANVHWVECGSVSVDVPNPYSEFTLSINSVTSIGKVDRDTFIVNYYLNGGTDNIQTCQLRIYKGGTRIDTINIGTGKSGNNQTASFSPRTTTYQHGSNYSVSVYAYDGTTEKETGKLPFYTYQEPLLSGVSVEKTSPQNANTSNKFTLSGTNNRKWTSYEDEFQTHYRIRRQDGTYTSWTNLGNITQWSRTAEQMRTLIPKQYDGQTNTIYFRRYNSRASWYSSERSVVMMLYYRPRMAIDFDSVTYHMNSTSGNLINKGQVITNTTTLNSIYINWNYDTTLPEAGYVQGYRVRLYDYAGNQVEGAVYYTTTKYVEIPKDIIPRLNMTYIDITPYFGNNTNNTSNYWYYNGTIEKIQFIRLVTELEKPQITYPIQNSIWINKDFRVCFKLPVDPDKGCETETYHYENIELKVNKIVYRLTMSNGTSSGSVDGSTIFSCLSNNLTYQRPVVIYPNLLGNVPNTDTYTIQVRVKKKYGTTSTEFRWSPWSDTRTFTVYLPTYEVQQYDLIMATHYNDAFDTVDNVRNTYGVSWTDKPLRAVAKSTIIKAEQYSYNTIMKKLVHTKNQVNNYATFDTNRDNIKFDYTNELPETFNEKVGEFITADKNEGNEYNGRNYIKFIYDRCKLLK